MVDAKTLRSVESLARTFEGLEQRCAVIVESLLEVGKERQADITLAKAQAYALCAKATHDLLKSLEARDD